MNRQHVTLLVFRDLSSAFDTVDHAILPNRLESLFGISETALSWFKSYLSDRKPYVFSKITLDGIFIGKSEMAPSEAVKDFGVWLDNTLSMSKHVTKLPSSCYFFLYNLRRIRKYVSNSAARLIHQSTRYSPSPPLLQDLHWLPIKYRCIFKILLITSTVMHHHTSRIS